MRCEQCARAGELSQVYVAAGYTTLMGYPGGFYHTDGVFHDHDPNRTTTSFRCSLGHEWRESSVRTCPAPGCGYGRTPEPASVETT